MEMLLRRVSCSRRYFFGRYQSNGGFSQYIIVQDTIDWCITIEGPQMLNILMLSVGALAFSIEDGVYTCVQSVETVQKRKDAALEETLSKTNFLIRSAAKERLKGKPEMCRTYAVENHEKGFRITCDKKPTIDLRTDGTPTEYPTQKAHFLAPPQCAAIRSCKPLILAKQRLKSSISIQKPDSMLSSPLRVHISVRHCVSAHRTRRNRGWG